MATPRVSGPIAAARAGPHAAVAEIAAGSAAAPAAGIAARTLPDRQQRAEQAEQRSQHGNAPERPHVPPQSLRLDPVGHGHRALQVGGRAPPPPDCGQGNPGRRAGIHLAVIEGLSSVELALVEAIDEPGGEVRRDDPPSSAGEPNARGEPPGRAPRRPPGPRLLTRSPAGVRRYQFKAESNACCHVPFRGLKIEQIELSSTGLAPCRRRSAPADPAWDSREHRGGGAEVRLPPLPRRPRERREEARPASSTRGLPAIHDSRSDSEAWKGSFPKNELAGHSRTGSQDLASRLGSGGSVLASGFEAFLRLARPSDPWETGSRAAHRSRRHRPTGRAARTLFLLPAVQRLASGGRRRGCPP